MAKKYDELKDDEGVPRDSMDVRIDAAKEAKEKKPKLTAEEKEKRRLKKEKKAKKAAAAAAAAADAETGAADEGSNINSENAGGSAEAVAAVKKKGSSKDEKKKKQANRADGQDDAAPEPVARPENATAGAGAAAASGGSGGDDQNMSGTFEPFWVRAIGDFEGSEPGDLPLRYMQLVEVLDMQPNGWWAGQIGERVGWFPSNHVERVDPLEIFLQRVGLSKCYDLLVEEDIDMESLALLTEEDLAGIGMKLGPRKQLLKALADENSAGLQKKLTNSRDISHTEMRRTLSVRSGVVPQNDRLTKDKPANLSRRTSQFLSGDEAAKSPEAYLNAAVYLKVIVVEQNLYKILAFEGNMVVKDCVRRVTTRLAKPLKRPIEDYTLFTTKATGKESDDSPMDADEALGVYRLTNMTVVLLKEVKKKGGLLRVFSK